MARLWILGLKNVIRRSVKFFVAPRRSLLSEKKNFITTRYRLKFLCEKEKVLGLFTSKRKLQQKRLSRPIRNNQYGNRCIYLVHTRARVPHFLPSFSSFFLSLISSYFIFFNRSLLTTTTTYFPIENSPRTSPTVCSHVTFQPLLQYVTMHSQTRAFLARSHSSCLSNTQFHRLI